MAYLNEVAPETVSEWLENFNSCVNNIFAQFQENPIELSKEAYDVLSANNLNHINIYFGLGGDLTPKIIAVGSYLLDKFDGEETSGFADILGSGKIYELYSNSTISVDLAREYTTRWKEEYYGSSLYLNSVLLPRPNFIKLFIEDEANPVEIFFGMSNDELKVMQKDPNGGTGAIAYNTSKPCPSLCPKQGLIVY